MEARGGPAAISAEPLFAVDAAQRVVAWNGPAATTFGIDARRALGSYCFQLLQGCEPRGRRFCKAGCPVVTAAKEGQPSPSVRITMRTACGRREPFDVSTIVLAANGHMGAVIHLCRHAVDPREALAEVSAERAGSLFGLTDREREVLAELCRGASTSAIAATLGLSETTVRNHIQRILEKLDVHSRAEAVARVFRT